MRSCSCPAHPDKIEACSAHGSAVLSGEILDKAVGLEVLKRGPDIRWIVSQDGESSAFSAGGRGDRLPSRLALEEWLQAHQRAGTMLGYKVFEIATWPRFSTDIATAWQVVEKQCISIGTCGLGPEGTPAGYWAGHSDGRDRLVGAVDNHSVRFGETAPLAICRAALAIVRLTEGRE